MINKDIIDEVAFIDRLKEDLNELASEECYQRHTPDYYEERTYYNWFHQNIPSTLLLSNAYVMFIKLYMEEGRNLYTAIKGLIEVYENGI